MSCTPAEFRALFAVRKLASQAGSCMHCPHGRSTYVFEFQMGGFVARLCARCLNDLFESAKAQLSMGVWR